MMSLQWLLTLAAVFVSVALFAGVATSQVLSWSSPDRRRMRDLIKPKASGIVIGGRPLTDSQTKVWDDLGKVIRKSPKEMNALMRRMATAGYYSRKAAILFSLSELVVPIVLGILPIALLGLRSGWIIGLFGAVLGFMVPGLVLGRIIAERKKAIANGLPDALDLLVLCLEAGSSLDQAIVKATEELEIAYRALADELRILTTEVRAGKPRLEAFRNFADRTKVEDVRSLVSMLVQTDRFGTSIALALRTHAGVSRTKRRQRAEERAGKVGVKLVFPLVFCLFPAFYVVMLGPAVIKFFQVFGH